MKKGAWLVNTARGAIVDADAVAEALASGHLSGYGGDVWSESANVAFRIHIDATTDVQPAPKDHPWRDMRNPLGK
jgi:formate dehydrogenase